MASSNLPAEPSAPAEQKKRPRPNPARRRAARANSEAKNAPVPASTDSAATKKPSLRRVVTLESLQDDLAKPKSTSSTTPRPAPIPRQKTEPPPLPRSTSQTAAKQASPKLARTVTAPPATKEAGTLALKGPALVTGGLVGCAAGAAVLLGVQLWYDFAGVESAILAAKSARLSMDNLTDELITSLKAGTYSADEALDMLRRTTLAYASTIPEGAPFVERIFREIDTVRKQRGREVDKVVAETYKELQKAGNQGASSIEMRDVVLKQLMKLSTFASNATQDVVARNPKLRPFRDEIVRASREPKESSTPTVRVNMAVRQKPAIKQ